ncbi:MAG TPA: zf-HC2 domain-containing protein, partial [Acidobacteriota bacterium]|nr:zf-HC2 domain-containing protein [Acidobacteriota bacterium]
MDCKKAEKLLVEYLYQELSPENTLEIEKHLETCDSCAKTLENWRGIHRGFQRSNDMPQPTPFLKTRILAAAREELDRQPGLAERLMVWVKPALILPILIFGLLVLLFLPSRQTEMARAKAPAQAETQAPPSPVTKPAQPTLDRETEEKLKSLGYLSDKKASEKPSTEQYDELKRKAESDRAESRDQAVSGGLVSTKKTGSYNEAAAPAAPKEAQPGMAYEAQPQQVAPQESGKVEQRTVMSPAAEQPQPPPAAAPQPASEVAGGSKPDVTVANFQKAQALFKNNDLPQ